VYIKLYKFLKLFITPRYGWFPHGKRRLKLWPRHCKRRLKLWPRHCMKKSLSRHQCRLPYTDCVLSTVKLQRTHSFTSLFRYFLKGPIAVFSTSRDLLNAALYTLNNNLGWVEGNKNATPIADIILDIMKKHHVYQLNELMKVEPAIMRSFLQTSNNGNCRQLSYIYERNTHQIISVTVVGKLFKFYAELKRPTKLIHRIAPKWAWSWLRDHISNFTPHKFLCTRY